MRAARRIILPALVALLLGSSVASAQRAFGPPVEEAVKSPVSPAKPPLLTAPNFVDAGGLTSWNPISIAASAGDALPPGRTPASPSEERKGGLATVINILVVLTLISLGPSVMLMTTCFMRILIVLGLLKQAMGTSTVPPPQAITGLALFMTLVVMSPTLDRINKEAIEPYRTGQVESYDELWARARQPMRDFMFNQIEASGNWSSLYMVLEHRGVDISKPEKLTRSDVDMVSLVPAFMLSELKVAFLLGFKVYLPFLVIDMVISTMLISMSMMMLPPVLVSLPFKLLLFVLVDGWALICSGLMNSFAQRPGTLSLAIPPPDVLAMLTTLSPVHVLT